MLLHGRCCGVPDGAKGGNMLASMLHQRALVIAAPKTAGAVLALSLPTAGSPGRTCRRNSSPFGKWPVLKACRLVMRCLPSTTSSSWGQQPGGTGALGAAADSTACQHQHSARLPSGKRQLDMHSSSVQFETRAHVVFVGVQHQRGNVPVEEDCLYQAACLQSRAGVGSGRTPLGGAGQNTLIVQERHRVE